MSSNNPNMARPPRRRAARKKNLFTGLIGNKNPERITLSGSPSSINMARSGGKRSNNLTFILIMAFGAVSITTLIIASVLVFNALFGSSGATVAADQPVENAEIDIPQGTQYENPLDKSGANSKAWDGSSRVNVLVLGLDLRDDEEGNGASRTDSLLVLTLDPTTSTAGILSIPRDVSVKVPGYGDAKVNSAYFLGASGNNPGVGGAALAVSSVEGLLQEPINYYVVINWDAFVKFIDEIGGVDIKVPADIKIGIVGSGHSTILRAGTQTLDGATALAYARARDTEHGDFDRAQRQQQVIMAVRDNILNYYSLPKLVTKAPALYKMMSKGIITNLSLQQIIMLSLEARKIPVENIQREVINEDEEVYASFNIEGQYVLIPIPEAMATLRAKFFHPSAKAVKEQAPTPAAGAPAEKAAATPGGKPVEVKPEELKSTATLDPLIVMKAENAKISVQNGTGMAGLAGKTAELLKKKGFNVVEETNAPDLYQLTEIHCGSAKPETIRRLAELLKIPSSRILNQNLEANESGVNLILILGSDWADTQ